MKLRTRLVLGVVLVAIPVAILATFYESGRERRRSGEIVRERTLARIESFDVSDCEADPGRFPDFEEPDPRDWLFGDVPMPRRGDGPGVRYFVLDANGRAFRDDAPPIPRRARRAIARSGSTRFFARRGHQPVEVTIVRPEWSSPICAALLVERPVPKSPPIGTRLVVPLAVTLAVTLAVLLIAGPVVRRIRKLTEAVARGDATSFADSRADELGELGRAFVDRESTIAQQIDELRRRESTLREHLAATSHDVLLPITVLQGHLVEIERASVAKEPLDPDVLRGALEETHYIVSLVRDLNADARLRTGLVVATEVDLGALVVRAKARNAPIAKHAGVELEVAVPETPVMVHGDETLLEQAISNLVHNAIRYGQRGGHVAVVLETTGGSFVLRVADDGPGVPEALLDRLGDRGFRTDEARTRRPEGTGLGLHIVREVCATHGVSVRFERGEPSGLVVTLEGRLAYART